MSYKQRLQEKLSLIDNELVNLEIGRKKTSPPTQVFSEFLTNKNQGDWAELTLMRAINDQSKKFIAVKYGLDSDKIAGEKGFNDYYNKYQEELDTIGKRPDLLIFHRNVYDKSWNYDLTNKSTSELDKIVPLACCGIEVRSSSFFWKKFMDHSIIRKKEIISEMLKLKDEILLNYSDLLKFKKNSVFTSISSITSDNIYVLDIPVFSYKKTLDLVKLSSKVKRLRKLKSDLVKRDYLSITPKIEDIKVVNNWIQKYGVPHFYAQVFFDAGFMISYEKIIDYILKFGKNRNPYYSIEKNDAKNQNKTTIKFDVKNSSKILDNIVLPNTKSAMRELGRGRILFYLKFDYSYCELLEENIIEIIGE